MEKAVREVKMAKISNFIYCLNSTASDNEANAMGVVSALTPDYLPGAYSFSILCSILDLEEGLHRINFKFKTPEDVTLVEVEGEIPYELEENSNLPRQYVGINIISDWQNVVFEKSGLYKTVVSIDGVESGIYEIFVKGKNEDK